MSDLLDYIVTDKPEIGSYVQDATTIYYQKITLDIEPDLIPLNYEYNVSINGKTYKGNKYTTNEAISYETNKFEFNGANFEVPMWTIDTVTVTDEDTQAENTTVEIRFEYAPFPFLFGDFTIEICQLDTPFRAACGGLKLDRETWNGLCLRQSGILIPYGSQNDPDDGYLTTCGQKFGVKDFKMVKSIDGTKTVLTVHDEVGDNSLVIENAIPAGCGGLLVDKRYFNVNEDGELVYL